MTEDFTLAGYRVLLRAFLDRGYRVCGYEAANPQAADLILRHDLDMSLDAALPVAEVEQELGVLAHYFVLLRTEMYNPLSAAGLAVLAQLRDLGHEIGLHLDASLYDNDPEALQGAASQECGLLEMALNSPVRVISFHRPAKALLGYDEPLAGCAHAYQSRFFKAMGYCSDSRGAWRHGHPLDQEAVSTGRALQLLTHPIWWPARRQTVQQRLDRFAGERYRLLRRELGRNCLAYDAEIPPTVGLDLVQSTEEGSSA